MIWKKIFKSLKDIEIESCEIYQQIKENLDQIKIEDFNFDKFWGKLP